MKRALVWLAALLACGCDRGPAKPGASKAVPLTDAQAVEAAWKRWQECAARGEGPGAWACLSRRTREERAALYRADAARIAKLSGPALESEARAWGVTAEGLRSMGPGDLAAAALGRDLRRADRAAEERAREFSGADVQGDVARVRLAGAREESIVMVREDGAWKIDDAGSRRAAR